MAETSQSDNAFAKVFIPGLIIGLLIGMAIGAFVPPLLERAPAIPQPAPGTAPARTYPSERDGQPITTTPVPVEKQPEEKKPEEKKPEPPKPSETPAQPTGGKTNP